jgi:dTMP kinase
VFVSLEGIDGSGKSTQARLLAKDLPPDTLLLREPGGTPVAERVRELLTDPAVKLDPLAELMLFCAARAQLVAEEIRPALDAGRDVVCDRFADSTVAYQGGGRGLGAELVKEISSAATGGLQPDLTLLLRIDPEAAAERRSREADRFEGEGLVLQRAVAEAYDEIAESESERVVVIDASGKVDAVHRAIMEAVNTKR